MTTEAPADPAAPAVDAPAASPAGPAAPAPAADPAAPAVKTDAPAEVDYKFTLPEGMAEDAESTTALKGLLKEHNVPADKAQAFMDLGLGMLKRAVDASQANYAAQRTQWQQEMKNDPALGGANFEANRQVAAKAIDMLGNEPFRQFLDETGLGDHPMMFKMLHALGNAYKESPFVTSTSAAPARRSTAEVLYGAG